MRMLLLGICTDTMCIVLSLMILDSPTDGKEGMLGTGEGFRLCVLSSDFGRCFWVQTNFGTSDNALFNIPLSNAKLQLGSCIHWIGWHFSFGSGTFSIPVEKVQKLKRLLQEALQGRHVSKRTLDKVTGLLQEQAFRQALSSLKPGIWPCSLRKTS